MVRGKMLKKLRQLKQEEPANPLVAGKTGRELSKQLSDSLPGELDALSERLRVRPRSKVLN
jgi:hypothetical protein